MLPGEPWRSAFVAEPKVSSHYGRSWSLPPSPLRGVVERRVNHTGSYDLHVCSRGCACRPAPIFRPGRQS
eukprot:3988835-Alexandrium_andersonii.AAC.1